ncbi:MAG: hypothetical protein Q7S76_04095 [bacterium]|nr:hypothetical protein [bacterium]
MSIIAFFGVLAAVFILLEIYPYVVSILGRSLSLQKIPEEDRTIPNLATWTILLVEGIIIAFSYYERNDFSNLWFYIALSLEYLIIATLSLWYGEHHRNGEPPFSRFDKICLAGAGAGLLGWYLLGSWEIPIAIIIIVDGFGMAPTIEKTWRLPRSESFRAWTMTVAGSMCALIALGPLQTWDFSRSAFTIYMMLITGIVWSMLFRRFQKWRTSSGII